MTKNGSSSSGGASWSKVIINQQLGKKLLGENVSRPKPACRVAARAPDRHCSDQVKQRLKIQRAAFVEKKYYSKNQFVRA
jgi:hypothetical protein